MRLRSKYNICALFSICLAVSLLFPVSVVCSKKVQNEKCRLNIAASLLSEDYPGFIDRYVDSALLKKIDRAAHAFFGKVVRVRHMIPEEDWITKIILLNNTATFAEYGFNVYSRRSWIMLSPSAYPQDSILAFSRRSPPSV